MGPPKLAFSGHGAVHRQDKVTTVWRWPHTSIHYRG